MGDVPALDMKPNSTEQAVFAAALERHTPEARAAYLDEACGADLALRRRVEALLSAAHRAGDFLETPFAILHDDADLTAELTEKPGDRLGRYKLLEKIGEGGCGVVYMAEQEEPVRRRVALKIIKLGMDTRSVIARFEAERQALAMMDHSNIAKVFDGGATPAGRPYFVMELVRGVRITEFCNEGRLPAEARLRLFVQVCQAVQHAHQKGIIHRDLKPSNILVTVNDGAPVPKVIDFGIAKATGERLTDKTLFTRFHAFIGTPAYTSPEQAEMSSVDIDTRTDIYSLGVLLYELLAGRPPFDGDELLRSGLDEMRRVIREVEPVRPSTCLTLEQRVRSSPAGQPEMRIPNFKIDSDLDWIVMKCLEKDRARRYETAAGLAADIRRHLEHEPVSARPPSRAYALRKLGRRHRPAFAAAGGLVAVLVVAVIALTTSNARVRRERNQKESALQERNAALEAAKASEKQARDQLFQSLKNQALAWRHSGRAGHRLESLAAVTKASHIHRDAELRDHAMAAMALPDIEHGPIISGPNAAYQGVAFDPAYQLAARIEPDGAIIISRLLTSQELQRLPAKATPAAWTRFSPDGRHLAVALENGAVQLWEWPSGRLLLSVERLKQRAIGFSPDNRLFAVAQNRGIICFAVPDGTELRRWETPGDPHALAFHPGNRRLAVGYENSEVVSIYDATTAELIANLPVGSSAMVTLGWHPAGRLLAAAGSDPGIQIWDATAQTRISLLVGHAQQVTLLQFHPGGEILLSASWDNTLRLWHALPGRQLMRLAAQPWRGFSKDGRWAGVLRGPGDQTNLWGVLPSAEHRTFIGASPRSESAPHDGDVTPDGALLAIAAPDGVRLWNVDQGAELQWLPMQSARTALFRNGGRELLTCSYDAGVQRWAVELEPQSELEPRIGSPHRLPLPFAPARMALSADQRVLAVVGEEAGSAQILDLETGKTIVSRLPHPQVAYVGLSPDAQWAATSGWHSEEVRFWSAKTGDLIRKWVLGTASQVFFTPDSRELIIACSEEFRFHDSHKWTLTRRFPRAPGLYPSPVAFTPDGTLMALELTPGVIDLKSAGTGQTVARLENPRGDVTTWMSFTPDGTQLIVAARYGNAISRWDLRACRARLKTMKLDWDWPEFPPSRSSRQLSAAAPPPKR